MPAETLTFEEAIAPKALTWEEAHGGQLKKELESTRQEIVPITDFLATPSAPAPELPQDYLQPLPPITDEQLAGPPQLPSLLQRAMGGFNRLFEPGPVKPSEVPMDASDRAKLEEAKNRVLLKEQIGRVESPSIGFRESLAEGARAVASPAGLATAAAATVAPEVVLPTLFATTAANVPETISKIQTAREEGDRAAYYKGIGDLAQEGLILYGTGKYSAGIPSRLDAWRESVAQRAEQRFERAKDITPEPPKQLTFEAATREPTAEPTPEPPPTGPEPKPPFRPAPPAPAVPPRLPGRPVPGDVTKPDVQVGAPESAAFTPEELAEMDKEVAASKALVDREWPPVYKRIQDATGLAKRDLEKLGVYESVDHPSDVRNLARDITANAPGGKMNKLYDQLAAEGHTGRFLWGGTADAPTIGFDPDVPGARPDPVAAKKAWDAVNAVRGVFGHEPLPDFFGAKATTAAATAHPEPPKPAPTTEIDPEITEILNSEQSPVMKSGNLRALASQRGVPIKDIQEAVEVHVVRASDTIARDPNLDPIGKFTALVNLYNKQPTLGARTSTSVELQAYSTPSPLSYAMSHATGVTPQSSVYDATAGNGMLFVGSDASAGQANEINPARIANLEKSGIGTVTGHDATKYTPGTTFPIVHLNPPFGGINNVNYNGYGITRLEHLISLKALEALQDDGVGMMILGAALHERPGGKGAQWVFENYLYGHYNVVANFEVAGDLYAKQGAKWPVRVIVVAGRKQLPETGVFAPETVARLNNWGDVWKEADRIRNEIESRRASVVPGGPVGLPVPPAPRPAPTVKPPGLPQPANKPAAPAGGGSVARGGGGRQPAPRPRPDVGVSDFPAGRPSDEPSNAELPVRQPGSGGKPAAPVEGGVPTKPAANVPTGGAGVGEEPGLGTLPKSPTVERPAGELTGMSEAELDSLLDEASGKPPPTVIPTAPPPPPPPPAAKSAGEIASDAAKLGVQGVDEALKGLHDLFGGGANVGIGPSFDENTYAKAKPHFQEAYKKFKDAGKTLKEFFQFIFQKFGERIREYLKRFMQELQGKPKEEFAKPPVKTPPQVEATEFQVPYVPRSEAPPFGTLIPKNISEGVHAALDKLVAKVGPLDAFVADRLNMDVPELRSVMAAEQIDGVAQALDQMDTGGALIVGHETGIGKGRIGAALIRYAILEGKIPMFFTKDPKLFTDMNGDLADIGTQVKPFILGDPGKASIVDAQGRVIHRAPSAAVQKREMQNILQNGMQGAGYNAIFVTYSQVNQRNARQQFLEQLARDNPTIIVLDEAHEAAGDAETSMQAAFMSGGDVVRGSGANRTTTTVPGLLNQDGTKQGQGGVLYMSATFAKRPENMPVYFRTDLRKSAQSFPQIVDAMKRGGVALQQAVSEALAKAGQYTRVERDFTGINFDVVPIKVDDPVKLEEDVDAVTDVLSEIVRFSGNMRDRVKASTAQSETQIDMTDFASVVHNQIGQLLLAVKSDHVVAQAIEAHKRGEKPLIALMNTMQAFLEHYVEDNKIKPGEKIQLRWNELLKYALSRTLRVSDKLPNGDNIVRTVDPDTFGLGDYYRSIQSMADGIESKFPVSPIDYIIQKLGKSGVKMAELTGRDSGIEYTDFDKGEGIYRHFPKANKNRVVNGFNNGDYDGMLLNASGSTGLSAHASVKFKDKKPRNMAIAQPALDINVFVQTLGRIKRTGMVSMGTYPSGQKYGARYTYPVLPLQAELRPAAMAAKKMKSLNANTTAAAGGAVKIDAEDIYNKYGDLVVSEYLSANPDTAHLLGLDVDYNDDGSIKAKVDVARKFTGRIALLPNRDQAKIYDEILPAYRNMLEQLKSTGDYDLEIVVHDDWNAVRKSDEQLAPGTDPSNIFTAGSRIQQWEITDKRHVPTGAEMQAEFNKNLGTREAVVKKWNDIESKFDTELAKREGDLVSKLDAAPEAEKPRISAQLASTRAQRYRWNRTKSWVGNIMDNMGHTVELRNTETGEVYHGLITNTFFPKSFNVAPSAFRFRFTVDDPAGSIYLTGGDIGFQKWDLYLSDKALSEFTGGRGGQRDTRYFVTGNPIQGLTATGGQGKMVRFKTNEGNIVTGLLMPRNWGPAQLANDPRADLISGQAVASLLRQHGHELRVEGAGGIVRIGRGDRGYLISVPGARRTGGAIYLNPALRTITGDFVKTGSRMVARINEDQVAPAAERISDILGRKLRAVPRHGFTGDMGTIIARVSDANAGAGGRPPGVSFFPRKSEAQGLGEQATAPTVEDVRRQRLLNREGTPVPPDTDTPTPPPTDPPLGVPEMNDEADIVDNVRRQDVLPARDWWASPEYEFRKNPVAIDLVTKAVEAELHYQAEVGRDYERFDELKRGLSKAQQINITKALRAAMEGDTSLLDGLPTHEREVATGIREYFDRVRRVIIEGKQRDLIDSLPEARAAAVHDILEGMDESDAFRAHRLRAAGQRAVREALAELEELENWGLEDYITNIERGSYKVLNPEGTIVAIAETRVGAKEKALKYARENPGTTHLTITDEFASGAEFPTKLTRGQYFRMARRAANALGTDVAEIQRMLRAEGSPIVVVKPPSKFAGALLQRRNILKGEDNIFDALPGYSYSIRKKLALDPVFKEVRGNLDKLPENMKSQVEELMTDIRGRYHVVDKIVDYLVAARFGTKPFAYSRGVGQARQVAAWLKLGYRPITALVNRLGGLQHTWVKTGTKYLIQGRTLRHSPGWDEIWARNRDYVGASAPAFLEGSRGREPLYRPLGLFQFAETRNRPEAFASFYKYAQGELGLNGEAAEAFARKSTRFAQFTYTVGSLPRILRSPTGKLVGQFKPYLVKELEFIFSLRGWEIPRYFTAFLAMGGPRAVIYMLRSLPILGALGILWMMEDWLNRKAPRASRGLPGYAGIDITASVTPQLPSTATDWAGPTLGDIYKLYDTVIRPAFEGETGRLHDFGTWASRLAPAVMYWSRMVEAITKKNGWMTDDRGRPQYKPGVGGKVAMAAGAKPLDQSVAEVNRAYMDHVNDITNKNREHLVDQILVAINKRDGATLNALLRQAKEYGIDTNAIKEAVKQQMRTPDERLRRRLLKSVRVDEAERLANPPKP